MLFFNKSNKHNSKDTRSNVALFGIAFICAIAGWFIVSIKRYPSAHKELYNIPVELDISGTDAATNGLKVITPKEARVKVSFDCARLDFSQLNADDIRAYIDFESISSKGTKPLKVEVKSKRGLTLSNISVSPPTINVTLDVSETKTFDLMYKAPNIKAAEGMIISDDEVTCTPSQISITGPSITLAKIKECYAVSNKEETLKSKSSINCDEFELYDENGSKLDLEYLTFDTQAPFVSLNLPVLMQKTVKIGVSLGVLPDNFDQNCLDFNITPDTITIAAKDAESNLPDPLQLPVSLSDIVIGYSKDFDIDKTLNDYDITNVSNTEKVNISLNSEGLASKDITIPCDEIPLTNKPSDNYDYNILTHQVTVTIVGPEEIINELTSKDLSATVNLLGADTSMDSFKQRVRVSCGTYKNVWAVGDKTVTVEKTPKGSKSSQSSSTITTNAY